MTMTQTAPAAPAKPAEAPKPPTPEELDKRLETLEIAAGLKPKPPHKETVTAYYKNPPFKPEPVAADESPKDKAAREARDKAAKEKAGKVTVYELPPVVFAEAKNGRVMITEQPRAVDDGSGHQTMVQAKWVVPEDADAWSLEDPDKKKDDGAPQARGK